MKTITIKQPWASLIVERIKDIENRTWKTNFRGRVLIHAGKSILRPRECIFTDAQWDNIRGDMRYDILHSDIPIGSIIGSVEIVDCVINHPSIWAEQSTETVNGITYGITVNQKPIYNWVLANPIKFSEPIPCKGRLSFWEAGVEVCHICGQPAPIEYICERCDEYYCEKHKAHYNQFTQIDYNCCSECAK